MMPPGWKFAERVWIPTAGQTSVNTPAASATIPLSKTIPANNTHRLINTDHIEGVNLKTTYVAKGYHKLGGSAL